MTDLRIYNWTCTWFSTSKERQYIRNGCTHTRYTFTNVLHIHKIHFGNPLTYFLHYCVWHRFPHRSLCDFITDPIMFVSIFYDISISITQCQYKYIPKHRIGIYVYIRTHTDKVYVMNICYTKKINIGLLFGEDKNNTHEYSIHSHRNAFNDIFVICYKKIYLKKLFSHIIRVIIYFI